MRGRVVSQSTFLKVGGKPALLRYPGHEFFVKVMKTRDNNRGEFRQLCAQMFMLFVTRRESTKERLCDIKGEAVDTFYYTHLDFDQTQLKPSGSSKSLTS